MTISIAEHPTPADVFRLLCPDNEPKGRWMCAGAHENGQVYSQALSWDGRDLVAAIENTTSSGDFKLHIAGTVDQACSASLNGQAIEIEEALVLFCDESAKMPKPKQLVRKPGMRAGR